jgi:hypothetical protein
VTASWQDTRHSCSSKLAGASGGEASWPVKLLQRLAGLMSAGGVSCQCLLLVDSQLQCSLDLSVAVTDATDASHIGGPHLYTFVTGRRMNQWALEMSW